MTARRPPCGEREISTFTVSDLLERHWLPTQEFRNLKPSTLAQYRTVVSAWILPHLGDLDVSALTPATVRDLLVQLRTATTSTGRAGLSARSLQLTVGVLKAACAFAVETGLLERNPIGVVRRPRPEERTPTTWTVDEARRFLASVATDPLAALWALLFTRGLRRGEAAGLRWRDVDLEQGTIRIVHTLIVVDGRVQESTPKTTHGRRTVPLDTFLIALLHARRRAQEHDRAHAGGAWMASDYVFTNGVGQRLAPDGIRIRFQKLADAVGLPRIRVHDARHSAASMMLASGVHPKVVQELLGHSHVDITLGLYGHVTPSMGRQAGEALSSRLLGPTP